MPRIDGVKEVIRALDKLAERAKKEGAGEVVVGYTQSYAVYVHENLEAHHPVGQAKYLEQPAREHKDDISRVLTTAVRKGASINQGLLIAGMYLQRLSQQLVPVDTGALKASAFTTLEE